MRQFLLLPSIQDRLSDLIATSKDKVLESSCKQGAGNIVCSASYSVAKSIF